MAIDHITVGDAAAISKINQAIDKANLVDGKADQTALSSEVTARANADTALQNAIDSKLDKAMSPGRVLGRSSTGTGNIQELEPTRGIEVAAGQIRIAASGITEQLIGQGEVTSRCLAIVPGLTLKGRATSTEGHPQDLTVAQLKPMLGVSAVEQGIALEVEERAWRDEQRPMYGQAAPMVRPGEAIRYFTAELNGEPAALMPLPDDAAVQSPFGKVAALVGASVIAPVAGWRIEPGHLYRIRLVITRAIDTTDPANDAVRIGVRWLSASKADVGTTELANILDMTVSDGRCEYIYTLATTDGPDVDAVPAAGGVYFRPFVETFGSGVTHVEVIQVVDASDAVVWSPDVESYRREIAGLTAQIEALSQRLEALET